MIYTLSFHNNYFLQSTPFEIHFAGFRSDTLTLQNHGWNLAVEDVCFHAFDRHELRFILKHDMLDLYAITSMHSFEFAHIQESSLDRSKRLRFNIQIISKNIIYSSLPAFSMAHIHEIDCRPEMIDLTKQDIKDLNIFKTLVKPDDALIIEPHKVADILQQIVDAQAPNQKEIRERIRQNDARNALKQTLHAQILTVAA